MMDTILEEYLCFGRNEKRAIREAYLARYGLLEAKSFYYMLHSRHVRKTIERANFLADLVNETKQGK